VQSLGRGDQHVVLVHRGDHHVAHADDPAGRRGDDDGQRGQYRVVEQNVGTRAGKEVVQAYLSGPDSPAEGRPVRVLAAFAVVRAEPGEIVQARLRIPARAFARYDEDLASWIWPSGQFAMLIGPSSRELLLSATIQSRI
jgi:beta-glucosidase